MAKIIISNSDGVVDTITWEADENFTELILRGEIKLVETKAVDIVHMPLSLESKILLSAVAGAAWQRITDMREIYNIQGDPDELIIHVER